MRYKLVELKDPRHGLCYGCVFFVSNNDCKVPKGMKSCIDRSERDRRLRYKIYISIPSPKLDSNVKVL